METHTKAMAKGKNHVKPFCCGKYGLLLETGQTDQSRLTTSSASSLPLLLGEAEQMKIDHTILDPRTEEPLFFYPGCLG